MNKMKNKKYWVALFCLVGLAHVSDAQEYVSFNSVSNSNNYISIPSGESWKLISYSVNTTSSTEAFAICSATNNFNTRISSLYGTDNRLYVSEGPNLAAGSILCGPLYVYLVNGSQYLLTFQKIKVSPMLSATAVVIPTSAAGDVDVKMEQSADNVTWTECLPGTYNSSTVKRFFRLRAVEK